MILMEAIKLSSEASEPLLGMRGPKKRPLELQRGFFFFGGGVSLFK